MATVIERTTGFVPHPEGAFVAVLRDVYVTKDKNNFFGQQKDKKDPSKGVDNREFVTNVNMEFITDNTEQVDGKVVNFAKYRATASLADTANLYKFLRAWDPRLDLSGNFDADVLIGKGAYITIKHNVSSKGDVFANVISAAAPPKGSAIPEIPHDFLRKHEREAQGSTTQPEDDKPF